MELWKCERTKSQAKNMSISALQDGNESGKDVIVILITLQTCSVITICTIHQVQWRQLIDGLAVHKDTALDRLRTTIDAC